MLAGVSVVEVSGGSCKRGSLLLSRVLRVILLLLLGWEGRLLLLHLLLGWVWHRLSISIVHGLLGVIILLLSIPSWWSNVWLVTIVLILTSCFRRVVVLLSSISIIQNHPIVLLIVLINLDRTIGWRLGLRMRVLGIGVACLNMRLELL